MICRGKHRICELSTVLMQTVFIIHNIWSWIITYVTSCAHIGLDHVHSRTFLTIMYAAMTKSHIIMYVVDCQVRSNDKHTILACSLLIIMYALIKSTYIVMHAVDFYVRRNTASNVYVSTKSIYCWLLWSYLKNTHIKNIDQHYRIVN